MPPNVAEPKSVLHLKSAAGAEVTLVPGGRVLLGCSDQAELVIPHEGVSWEHAELRLEAGRAEVRDLDSTNGT